VQPRIAAKKLGNCADPWRYVEGGRQLNGHLLARCVVASGGRPRRVDRRGGGALSGALSLGGDSLLAGLISDGMLSKASTPELLV
jgi:hypothetical protein